MSALCSDLINSAFQSVFTFSGLCHDFSPFARRSKQEIVKLKNYYQRWAQSKGVSAVNISCRYRIP